MSPYNSKEHITPATSLMSKSRILRFLYPYRKKIFMLFIFSLFSSSFLLIGPYLSKLFIDKAFIGKNLRVFLNLGIIGSAIFLFSTIFGLVEDVIKNRIRIRLNLSLSGEFTRKLYSLDLEFLRSKSVGENIYRLSNIDGLVRFVVEVLPRFLVDIFKLPIILGISLWANVHLTIFLIILSPIFLLHSVYFRRRLRPVYEEVWKFSAALSKKIHEAFSKWLIIKAFGLELYQRRSYIRSLIENIRMSLKSFRLSIVSSLTSAFLSKAIFGAISLYGGWLIIKGRLSLGSYTAVMLYLTQLGGLLQSLSYSFEYFVQEAVSLERFFEIFDADVKIKDLPGARPLSSLEREIQFRQVWFGYQEDQPVIKGLDFKIPIGSWAGVAGPSGCGKTTIVNLILRLYEPWSGEIFLDSSEIKKVTLMSLRKRIAIATQEPSLFDLSVRENISYGLRHITQRQVIEAAKIACAHNFINQLPQGYDTMMGEDACRLSQGQKQRIAIARAIVRNSDLLILDEATSSVDSGTEAEIFQALRERRQGLTTVIVSHKLFSIKDVNPMYFINQDGQIEIGTHQELLSASTQYRVFFQNQMEEQGEAKIY